MESSLGAIDPVELAKKTKQEQEKIENEMKEKMNDPNNISNDEFNDNWDDDQSDDWFSAIPINKITSTVSCDKITFFKEIFLT